MDRFWLKSYPEGVPSDIDPGAYPSLNALIDESLSRHRSRPAYICMDRTMRFGELDERSRAFAAWLQSQGYGRGQRIAVMLPNLLQFPVAIAGVLRAGCTAVCVNPLYTPRELEHQLKDSGAEAIVILENFAATLQQVIARTAVRQVVLASVGEMLGPVKGRVVDFAVRHVKKLVPAYELAGATRFAEALDAGTRLPYRAVQMAHDDLAFLQYTGGTTGLSKGAMLSHRNVVAAILQGEAWFQPVQDRLRERFGEEGGTALCALPLYHIYMLAVAFGLGMKSGTCQLLVPNPRDIPGLIAELAKHPVNTFPALNTLFNALANHPDFAKLDFSRLLFAGGGGMATQQAVADKWFEVTGVPLGEGFGLSETCAVGTINPVTLTEFSGTVGLPVPSCEVSVRDDDGNELPIGQRGELCLRGPQVMVGYWHRADETAKAFTPDGFFKTGDIGLFDERGYVKIVDRKKDMILVSGFNVFPNEIEEVVATHPGVLECAAIGVPDGHSGEAIKVFVVRKDPGLTERDVQEWCAKHLTGYKKPKHIEFRGELPKSNVGKILRRELRDGGLKKAA
ncbi:MAG: long-chain-fatty-acid--CoA ligase [Burkholderiales bacterium]|nr:MAG: long-chain-fatty-acid--CoA ligase [Burkholderiales bacterium]